MLEMVRLSHLPPAAELWTKTIQTFLMVVGEVLLIIEGLLVVIQETI